MKWETFMEFVEAMYLRDEELLQTLKVTVEQLPEESWFPIMTIKESPQSPREEERVDAHVEGHDLSLDTEIIKSRSPDVRLGILAHELAHIYLDQYSTRTIEDEYDADDQARTWGFDAEVTRMRAVLGPPTLEE
jgi:predicted metal-dependent peptidase